MSFESFEYNFERSKIVREKESRKILFSKCLILGSRLSSSRTKLGVIGQNVLRGFYETVGMVTINERKWGRGYEMVQMTSLRLIKNWSDELGTQLRVLLGHQNQSVLILKKG